MIGMSYAERLERGLMQCARRYAPRLALADWQQPGDYTRLTGRALPDLAHALAGNGVLVMAGDVPPQLTAQAAIHHRDWVEQYKSLYTLLAAPLFPTFRNVQAFYIDQNGAPALVGLQGDALPVIEMLAGYITPYAAARQNTTPGDVELVGLLEVVLEELEAGDLPREAYRAVRDNGAAFVRQILIGYVRQIAVTPALRNVFGDATQSMQPIPPTVPPRLDPPTNTPSSNTQTIAPPPPPIQPPTLLPEEDRIAPAPPPGYLPEEPLFKPDSIPVFFSPSPRERGSRRPPVPDLPDE